MTVEGSKGSLARAEEAVKEADLDRLTKVSTLHALALSKEALENPHDTIIPLARAQAQWGVALSYFMVGMRDSMKSGGGGKYGDVANMSWSTVLKMAMLNAPYVILGVFLIAALYGKIDKLMCMFF